MWHHSAISTYRGIHMKPWNQDFVVFFFDGQKLLIKKTMWSFRGKDARVYHHSAVYNNLSALSYFLDLPQRQSSFHLLMAFLIECFYDCILEGPIRVTALLKMIIFRETLNEYSYLRKPNTLCQTKTKPSSSQGQKHETPWPLWISFISYFWKPEVKILKSKLWFPLQTLSPPFNCCTKTQKLSLRSAKNVSTKPSQRFGSHWNHCKLGT